MRMSFARYAVLALLAVTLSGCYANGKWSAPDLAFWKKDPPPNSYAPDANVTPSQVASRQGAPAPGDGYAGLSDMAAPKYTYPETQTGYDPGGYNPGGYNPGGDNPGGYDPGGYQHPANTQTSQDWQNQSGYTQPGQTQGYDPNTYGTTDPNAGSVGYVAPQQSPYGQNMASGGSSQAIGGQPYVGGQVHSGLGATSGTGYGTPGTNNYRSGDLYGNPIRAANQGGMAANPTGTSYQDQWGTQRTASRDGSLRSWDTSAGQSGINSGYTDQYKQYDNGTSVDPAVNQGSGVGMSAPAGTGMQGGAYDSAGFSGGTTPYYDFDNQNWKNPSTANTQTSAGIVDGYQTGVGSGPQNIPNPYVNSQTSTGQAATDYPAGGQYPGQSLTPGYDYPQPKQPDPHAAGQPQPFRPGSTGAGYQSPSADFSGASAAKSYSNYPSNMATYPQGGVSAGSQLPNSQPANYQSMNYQGTAASNYQNNTTPIGYRSSTPPIDYASGAAANYPAAAPNAATGSTPGTYQPVNNGYPY